MIYPKPQWVGNAEMERRAGEFILECYAQLHHFVPMYKNHTPNRWTREHAMIPHINDCLMIFRKGFVFNIAAWDYFTRNEKQWGDDDGVFFPIRWDGRIKLWNQHSKQKGDKNEYHSFKLVADKYLISNHDLLSEAAARFFDL